MFHEWWGLNDDITHLADALAAQGYVVLAPDAYRGKTTRWIPRAVYLVSTTDEGEIAADMDASFSYLANLENVDAKRMGSVGFCFGGRQSLNLAARRGEALAAVVSLYGAAYTDKAPLEALPASVPILGIYGEDDASIPVDDVRIMDNLMSEVGLNHEITIYPGVGHAFVTDENYNEAGAGGDAWNQLTAFFAAELQDAEGRIRPNLLAKQSAETAAASLSDVPNLICLVSH
jgi:carboxymethylenebutenolidase